MPFRMTRALPRIALTLLCLAAVWLDGSAQVRGVRRGTVVKGNDGKAIAAGPRGVAVKGEDGFAAAGRRGAVVKGDEGYAAVGRRGAVVKGDDGYAAVGRRGAVVAGEDGFAAVGRRGVVVGNHYESYDAWRAVAGAATMIAVGTMLARPPAAAVTINVGGSSYWYSGGAYYTRVMSNGAMAYQVVEAPMGAVITTLPVGCSVVRMGNVSYSRCGATYYERIATGYRVVVIH
jgi:Family of unknown function (DUF6515)